MRPHLVLVVDVAVGAVMMIVVVELRAGCVVAVIEMILMAGVGRVGLNIIV